MKKTTTKSDSKAAQLRLMRNVIRELAPKDLHEVAGGQTVGCHGVSCPYMSQDRY